MALPDLTGQNIENTYQRVIQTDGTNFYDGTGSLVNFGGAVFPYTGSAIISGSLIVTGSTDIQYLTASGFNYPTVPGVEGNAIVVNQDGNLVFAYPKAVTERVKNVSGGPLPKGTPVHATGSGTSGNIVGVVAADAGNPLLMPATFVLNEALADEAEGEALVVGYIQGVNTTGFDSGEVVYVGVGGGFTNVKPTGSNLIQNLGIVLKGNSNNGSGVVYGSGRSNDVPNLPPGYAWIGNENWVATAVPTSSFNEDPFPYTGSAAISGSLEVTGDVTIYGTASVNVLITNYESSSIIYSSGSTKFGDSLDDTHIFTGSVSVEGGITTTDNITIPRGKSLIFPNHPTQAGGISIGDNFSTSSPGTNFVRIGNAAGYEANANKFIAIGDEAGRSSSGQQQIFIGFRAGRGFDNSNNVVVIGHFAAWGDYSNADVDNAVILGTNAGQAVTQTDNVVIIGTNAGYNTEYSSKSVIIGDQAGYNHSGSSGDTKEGNVFIGYQAGYNELGSNKLIIANTGSKALVTGDFANNTFNISGSVSASTYYGDGSNLTGIETDPFPYTGSAIISGSLTVTGSISSTDTVTAVTGSFSHLKGNSPITVQDPTAFQQTLSVLGNATLSSINEVDIQTISKDFNYTSSLNVAEITASVNGAIIDYRLTNLNSGSRVGTFMYAHDGTTLSYNDLTIPGGGIGANPILSASLVNDLVKIDIENAAGFNFTGYAKKFNRLANAIPVADPNVTYVLNEYPSQNVVGAYSIRQLDQFYTGPAMRVRRASDNSELDIEYDVNGYLDTLAIEAHCGGSVGHVTIWYDQSGNNRHLTQSTAANQPKIYDGTSIYEVNGQPCIRTRDAASNPVLEGLSGIDYTGGLSMYQVLSNAGYGTRTPVVGSAYNDYGNGGWRFQHSTYLGFLHVGSNSTSFQGPRNDNYQVVEAGFYDSITNNISAFVKQQYGGNYTPLQTGSGTSTMPSTIEDTLFINSRGNYQELIIMNDYEISNREGIFTNINNYYNIYDTGLLVEYPGAAAAYSVRLLDSAYTGSALRIREDGTNTETDIGFDSNGDLDTASITSHCSSNNGLVVTWYDQSGNGNDATQTTTTNQPLIYSASTVITENGKPTIQFNGQKNMYIGDYSSLTEGELFVSIRWMGDTSTRGGFKISTNGFDMHFPYYGGAVYDNFGSTSRYSFTPSISLNQLNLYNTISTSSEWTARLNTNVERTSTTNTVGFSIGRIGTPGQTMNHNVSEYILYSSAQSSNRTGIETNINSYFNIYS